MARPRLTPHQAEVYERIRRWTLNGARSVDAELIGSRGACQHLVAKGYLVESEVYGPRGGTFYRYELKAGS